MTSATASAALPRAGAFAPAAVADAACALCGAEALAEFPAYAAFPRVTSDTKPWPAGGRIAVCRACGTMQKVPDAAWRSDISRIYSEFEIYHQAGGKEQPIFDLDGAGGRPRSARLVDYVIETLSLDETGSLLDFGCGNGATLAAFNARRPAWALDGAELSEDSLPQLQAIPGFRTLHTTPPSEIAAQFDLITLIHALEHLDDPVGSLRDLSERLAPDAALFVQVPDCGRNPYDLLVADHLSHFTLASLGEAARRAGVRSQILSDSVLSKELSWIGRRSSDPAEEPPPASPEDTDPVASVVRRLDWLASQLAQAHGLSETSRSFGLFGTAISATWLAGALGDRVAFFLDEDPARVGGSHLGRPILHPKDAPRDADVFVPLIPAVARAVAARLGDGGSRYHEPAAFA